MGVSLGLVQNQNNQTIVYRNLSSWADFSHRKVPAIGDSITFGANASPIATAAWFPIFCNTNGYAINNLGISGQYLVNDGTHTPFFDSSTIPTFDDSQGALLFNLGINDARASISTVTYQTTLDAAIATAISKGWPPNRILIGALWWINIDISGYVAACLAVAQKYHTMYADFKALIAAACNPATQYIDVDGVHPTTAGHTVIANIFQTLNLTPQ